MIIFVLDESGRYLVNIQLGGLYMKLSLFFSITALSLNASALTIIQSIDSNISAENISFISNNLVKECPQLSNETLYLSIDQYLQNKVGSDPGMVDRYWHLSLENQSKNIQVKASLVDQYAENIQLDQVQILGLTCHRYGIHD